MSDVEVEEDGAESEGSDCQSTKSDQSKGLPEDFSNEPGPSGTKLRWCSLSEISCASLASSLKSNHSHLRELELNGNKLQNSKLKQLCSFLEIPHCRLKSLRLRSCSLSEISCAVLASPLKCNPSHLRELDLKDNNMKDSDVKQLCDLKESPECRRNTLELRSCSLSDISCAALASSLKSNPSHLRELDLKDNNVKDSDVKQLSEGESRM
ncbi:NACHT, LRR and PYD domains-containing protein 12 [Perca flavescens]|uniref:NACHT, LRR and PYD domains-containing protein 12 n=1 Tax=Perca flavescens TaxID=8167 RepID=UPI00106E3E61|nr:NACHT, LRR and PYD domains-containing protein 12-like [Perca flavescens]